MKNLSELSKIDFPHQIIDGDGLLNECNENDDDLACPHPYTFVDLKPQHEYESYVTETEHEEDLRMYFEGV